MNRIAYLDGWRGCAILSVLAAHFLGLYMINLGRFGVELFFVLSGRLMAEILFVRRTPLSSFFPRRLSRIYPALFVLATLLYLTADWRGGDPGLAHYLTSISFTANYAQFWIGRSPVLDHIWSLCIEEHMYILLGLLAFVHKRRPLPVAAICAVLAVLAMINGWWQTRSGLDYYEVYWRTDVRGASLLCGVVAYLTLHDRVPRLLSWSWTPLLCGAAGLLLNFDRFPDTVKYTAGSALIAVALVLMPRAPRFAVAVLESPILLHVGVWSYSLYLWQQPFAMMHGAFPMSMAWLAAAFLCAMVSFYLVERPARAAINRRLSARSSRVTG